MHANIERAAASSIRKEIAAYAELLVDAVDSGAGMGFAAPLPRAEAEAYWEAVARDVDAGTRVVLAARIDNELAGSAQLDLCQRSNGLHRAEVQKVMVHRRFRRRGLGRALMLAVDDAARAHKRSTLYLDTFAHQDARRMYEAAGWTHAGDIPAFASTADGKLEATSLYYRLL